MKIKSKAFIFLFFLIGIAMNTSINAQDSVPLGIRYQAVARDDNGNPLVQRDVVAKMQIVQMDQGLIIWEELHYLSTNELGLFQLQIGKGFSTGEGLVLNFGSINWGKTSLALHVELDFGLGFLNMGSAMLQSVPYAFLADSALKAPLPDMELKQLEDVSSQKPTKNQPLAWNGKEWLPGDSLKVVNLLIQDEVIINQKLIVEGAIKIGDSGLIHGVTTDSNLSDASDHTLPSSKAIKSYVDGLAPYQGTNTDNQELSLSGTLLNISGGNAVDLAPIQDGTEDADSNPFNELQQLSIAGSTITISEGNSIDLPLEGTNADADSTNEIQDLKLDNNILTISKNSSATPIDLSPYQGTNTDNQELSLSDKQLSISNGNTIDLSLIDTKLTESEVDAFVSNNGYISTESDPIFAAHPANSITSLNITNWNEVYEWGDHAEAGYLTSISAETDPIFSSSPAASISTLDINTWNSSVNYWNLNGNDIYVLNRDVGIGTSSPAASLHVANNEVVFTAPYTLPGTPDAPPVSGQGTRMMWYPDKAAFRVGGVQGTNWDRNQVGNYSFATGSNTMASGSSAFAGGSGSTASGGASIAYGNYNTASGYGSVALGNSARSLNRGSVAIGDDIVVNGEYSVGIGFQIVASGRNSVALGINTRTYGTAYGATAMGFGSKAQGTGATALGYSTQASRIGATSAGNYTEAIGESSTAIGQRTLASGYSSLSANLRTTSQSYASSVFGRYNIIAGDSLSWIDSDPLFVIGNGSSSTSRNNAVTVLKNGNMDVDGDLTAARFFGDGSGLTGIGGAQCLTWNSSLRRLSISGCSGYVWISDYWEPNTDDQTLSISGHQLTIENGNTVTLPDNVNDADASPSNELQTLGFSGYNLSLSPSGGSVTFPWANNGSSYAYSYRNIGINTTTPSNDFVIYNSSGRIEMDYRNISFYNESVKKIELTTSTGNSGWIGTKGPANSYNAVIGYVTGYPDFGSIAVLNNGSNFRAGMQVNSNGAGSLNAEGPNDNLNFLATYLHSSYPNNGYASVNDASGNWQARMYVNTSGNGVIEADSKSFRIPHPNRPGYDIVYACIEGPEAAAYVRGTAELSNGMVNIIFPDHFQVVATETSMTILITPLSADSKGLAVVEKSTSGFTVKELANGTGTYAFDWEAKCIRKGYESFKVVQESGDDLTKGSHLKSSAQPDNGILAPEAR